MATRAELRRYVGNMLGDVHELTATMNGSTTTFIDTISLSSNIETPRNRDIVFTDGHADNIGLVRRVTNYDLQAGYIVFDALPQATAATDTAEMYNFRGKGFRVNEYNSALNQAIREANNGLWKLPVSLNIQSLNINADDHTIDLSGSGFTHIHTIDYLVGGTSYSTIPASNRENGYGWWVNGTDKVYIEGFGPQFQAAGSDYFVVYGFGRSEEFEDDITDVTIPTEWITNKTAELLCMSALDRDQGNFARGQNFARKADMALPSIRTRVPGSTRRVDAF